MFVQIPRTSQNESSWKTALRGGKKDFLCVWLDQLFHSVYCAVAQAVAPAWTGEMVQEEKMSWRKREKLLLLMGLLVLNVYQFSLQEKTICVTLWNDDLPVSPIKKTTVTLQLNILSVQCSSQHVAFFCQIHTLCLIVFLFYFIF